MIKILYIVLSFLNRWIVLHIIILVNIDIRLELQFTKLFLQLMNGLVNIWLVFIHLKKLNMLSWRINYSCGPSLQLLLVYLLFTGDVIMIQQVWLMQLWDQTFTEKVRCFLLNGMLRFAYSHLFELFVVIVLFSAMAEHFLSDFVEWLMVVEALSYFK